MTNLTSRLMAFAIGFLLSSISVFSISPNVSLFIKMTSHPNPGEAFQVDISIQKGELKGISKFQIKAPYGTIVNVINSQGANFVKTEHGGKFIWMELPNKEEFNLSYELTIPSTYTGEYDITGGFFYLEKGNRKSIFYHSMVNIENNTKPINITSKDISLITIDKLLTEKRESNLSFSIQVGAYSQALSEKQILFIFPNYILKEMKYRGANIYLIGHFNNLKEAVDYRDNLPYKDSFIVPIYKGKRVTVFEALKKLMM